SGLLPQRNRSQRNRSRASCPASGAGGPRLLPPSIGARNSAAATPVLPNVYSALLCFDRLSELSSAIDEFSSGYQQDCARAGERGRLKSHRGNSNTIVALAGNKADVLDTRQVSADKFELDLYVIGIVLHLEPLKHIGGRPYREAVLMDSRWDLIIVGVWTDLLQRNALRWSLARVDKNIIIGTLLRCNHKHRCLETSDHSTIHFNPDHHTKYRLK
ncbi:hypothetical protein ACJX0J_027878, partial [Zea mays]